MVTAPAVGPLVSLALTSQSGLISLETGGPYFMPERVDYHRHLASREWALLKQKRQGDTLGVCERCHLLPMRDLHHLTYERLGHERDEDVLGVCGPCHEFLSGVSDFDPAVVLAGYQRGVELRLDVSCRKCGTPCFAVLNGGEVETHGTTRPCRWEPERECRFEKGVVDGAGHIV